MNAIIAENNLITIADGEPVTTSLALAEGTGTQHKNIMELIRKYADDLQQFGRVAFETQSFETAGGAQKKEVAKLNEPQSTLIMTYMKNTEIVRKFKMTLVKAFFEARDKLLNKFDPTKLSRSDILRIALDAEEENQKLAAKIEADAPKVEFADKHVFADGWFCLRDAAKQIGYPPRKFNDWLHAHNYIFRQGGKHWMPYSEKIKAGLFKVKSGIRYDEVGEEVATQQCMVTAKGIQHFAKLLEKEEVMA